jgi:hypothetical protein
MQTSNSYSGSHMGEFWRDARNSGYFSYRLTTNNETDLTLMVRYWGNEWGNRTFDILIDEVKLVTENVTGKWNVSEFRNVEYAIPDSMVEGKDTIRVKFQAPSDGYAGGAFYIRLLRPETTDIKESMNQPHFFKLHQNYPNPFNPKTTIKFALPKACTVNLKVYDMMGQEVAMLVNEELAAGNHCRQWNASKISSGVYFYRLTTNTGYIQTKKLLLLK